MRSLDNPGAGLIYRRLALTKAVGTRTHVVTSTRIVPNILDVWTG